MHSSSSHSPSFSHFRLPYPHPHSYSQPYPAIPGSDIPLETAPPRCALRGSLDPVTGIFYKAPEHTRIRTAQACDKCRVRKAKCSGDHPICERCHTRGLICHYAPEQRAHRWSKTKAEHGAVLDRSTSRSGVVPRSPDVLQPARPRSKSGSTSTSHGPPSRNIDADNPWSVSGNGNSQRIGGMALPARSRRATIASTEIRSLSTSSLSPEERAVQSEPSFSQQILDLRWGGPDLLQKGRGHPVSVSRSSVPVHVGVAHEALEMTEESVICRGMDGEGTLEGDRDLDLDTPRVEENALALRFDPYVGDTPVLLESILTSEATGDDMSRVTPRDHDLVYINPGLIGVEYPESIGGTQHPMLFHHPPRSDRSGPGPGSCFDMSSVVLGMMSNDERSSLCCASDAESPDRTPSTSSSASPVLTRASSDGLPTTPTNSNPNSPFTLASLSLHLGPSVSDPNAYPLTTSEVLTMDMGMDGRHYHHGGGGGKPIEYVGWREVKDEAHSFWGDLDLFVDMDAVF